MQAVTRCTSGTYWLQSRIASGSQAARCCGVHCCATAGEIANVSARASSARASRSRRSVDRVAGVPISDPPVCSLRGYLLTIEFWRDARIGPHFTPTRQYDSRRASMQAVAYGLDVADYAVSALASSRRA